MLSADRVQRRWTVAAAVGAVAGMSYAGQATQDGLMLTGLILVAAVYYVSAVGVATYIPEILPTGIRLRGMGLAVLIGRSPPR